MKQAWKQKEAVMQPLKPRSTLRNTPFAKDHCLLTTNHCLRYYLPLFEGNEALLGVDFFHSP